jgi:uncharacterized phage protein (TIGR02220 family)
MKETFYFSHDYNTRTDPKIKRLLQKHGILGYGIFWALVEDLYQNANALPTDYESIAYDLRTECELVKSIVNDFDLFKIIGDTFQSLSIERRLVERSEKSNKAKVSANARWNKVKDANAFNKDANALLMQSDSNAIKESKEKESKEKESKEKESKEKEEDKSFNDELLSFLNTTTGKSFKIVTSKSEKNIKSRLKQGFTIEDIKRAIVNCSKNKYHIENPQYLTLEFITRADSLEKYLNVAPAQMTVVKEIRPLVNYGRYVIE